MERGLVTKAAFGTALVLGGFLAAGGCSGGNVATSDGGLDGNNMGDTSVADTGADTKKDMNVPDNQPMCPTPEMLVNFMPPAFIPPKPVVNVCTPTQVTGYWDNCRAPQATMGGCATWKGNNASCVGCIETQRTDTSWGPLVMGNGITFLNISGCEVLQNDMTCAKNYQALGFCDYAACDKRCPVTDFFASDHGMTLQEWQTCSQTADNGSCNSFATKVNQTCTIDAGTASATCFKFTSFQEGYALYATMFCSGGG